MTLDDHRSSRMKRLMTRIANGQQILQAMVIPITVQMVDMKLSGPESVCPAVPTGVVVALKGGLPNLSPHPSITMTIASMLEVTTVRASQLCAILACLPKLLSRVATLGPKQSPEHWITTPAVGLVVKSLTTVAIKAWEATSTATKTVASLCEMGLAQHEVSLSASTPAAARNVLFTNLAGTLTRLRHDTLIIARMASCG